jgi:hypothetical protein
MARLPGTRLPNALAIAIWITACSWAVAAVAWLVRAETDFLTPLVAFGVVSGALEWWLRRKS